MIPQLSIPPRGIIPQNETFHASPWSFLLLQINFLPLTVFALVAFVSLPAKFKSLPIIILIAYELGILAYVLALRIEISSSGIAYRNLLRGSL